MTEKRERKRDEAGKVKEGNNRHYYKIENKEEGEERRKYTEREGGVGI